MKGKAWLVSAILLSSSLPVYAASVSDMARQEQLQQTREADAARNERLRRPTVSMEGVTTNVTSRSIVPGGPSFFIREIQLERMTDEFSFLHQYLEGKDHHQQMHSTSVEVGIAKQRYSGADTWYLRLGHRMGLGRFGAMPENLYEDGPKSRYYMWLFDVDYQHPFTMGNRPAAYVSSFHGQWTTNGDRLYGVDDISMGNRYTVPGRLSVCVAIFRPSFVFWYFIIYRKSK